ncbi:MAG: DUF302 domain-containing protein [Candidatus Gracilibacteria bacterium]|nr:DUF302 domain-containing protein [Candidatus Gracilibacteria bacterium]
MMHFGISKKTSFSFEETVERVGALLTEEGFGILTKIDVQQKMKEKLGKEMGKYLILGACHPPSAYEAIQNEIEIGLLLPCNVIVYEKGEEVFVSAMRPSVAMGFVNNKQVEAVAVRIEKSLEKVVSQA